MYRCVYTYVSACLVCQFTECVHLSANPTSIELSSDLYTFWHILLEDITLQTSCPNIKFTNQWFRYNSSTILACFGKLIALCYQQHIWKSLALKNRRSNKHRDEASCHAISQWRVSMECPWYSCGYCLCSHLQLPMSWLYPKHTPHKVRCTPIFCNPSIFTTTSCVTAITERRKKYFYIRFIRRLGFATVKCLLEIKGQVDRH